MSDARPDCMEFEQGLAAIGTVKKFIPPVEVDELKGGQGDEGLARVLKGHYFIPWDLATPLVGL